MKCEDLTFKIFYNVILTSGVSFFINISFLKTFIEFFKNQSQSSIAVINYVIYIFYLITYIYYILFNKNRL